MGWNRPSKPGLTLTWNTKPVASTRRAAQANQPHRARCGIWGRKKRHIHEREYHRSANQSLNRHADLRLESSCGFCITCLGVRAISHWGAVSGTFSRSGVPTEPWGNRKELQKAAKPQGSLCWLLSPCWRTAASSKEEKVPQGTKNLSQTFCWGCQ